MEATSESGLHRSEYDKLKWVNDTLETDVNIQITYLVNLRDRTGKRQEQVSFSQGSTLQDVAEWLNGRYGLVLPDPQIMTISNGRGWDQYPQKWLTEIRNGDVICLFPPISGG